MNEVLNNINYAFQDCIEFIETNKDVATITFFIIVCIMVVVNAINYDFDDDKD